jgi:Uma2 family endonuclease
MARVRTHQIHSSMPTKRIAYDDYARLPDDGQRYEVLDGEIVVSPAAGTPHQRIQLILAGELLQRVQRANLGRVFPDVDCELGKHDIVRPDLIVVLPAHYERILPSRLLGTPDLAIEILSKSTAARDRNQKRLRYQAVGTPELWLVDGDAHTVTQFVHDGSKFGPPRIATESLRLAILPDVEVPFAELW